MEEPVFIKCEPGLLPDSEESFNVEQDSEYLEVVKAEPSDVFVDPNVEEINVETVKEELDIQNDIEGIYDEECGISGAHSNHLPTDGECGAEEKNIHSSTSDEAFKRKRDLEMYTLEHSGIEKNSFDYLKKEMPDHSQNIPYTCLRCKRNFKSRRNFQNHISNHDRVYKCSVCAKSFNRRGNMKVHMKLHSGIKPYECSMCEKTFAIESGLKLHYSTHSNEKPFSCSSCQKVFKLNVQLKRHLKRHTGEKGFSCSLCGKSFTQKTSLLEHNFIHTGEMPFNCNTCKRSFRGRSAYRIHLRRHTGYRPYQCVQCKQTFSVPGNLRRHVLRHGEMNCDNKQKYKGKDRGFSKKHVESRYS